MPARKKITGKEVTKVTRKKTPFGQPKHEMKWQAAEFAYYQKDFFWMFGMAILLVGLILLSVQLKDYLLAVVCLLSIVVLFQYSHKKPAEHEVNLGQHGIIFRKQFYPYTGIKSFWVVDGEMPKVYFEQVSWGLPLTVLLGKESLEEVRGYLLRYLPEHPTATEHFTDRVGRMMRF